MPPEQRRAAIVEATIPLLEEHGQALTTRMVAEAAGVAEGTIFRVFDSLDDLIAATILEALSSERLSRRLAATDTGDTVESRTRAALHAIEDYLRSVRVLFLAAHGATAGAAHNAAHCARNELEARTAELDQWVVDLLEPHRDRFTLSLDAYASLLRTLAFGHSSHFVSPSLSHDDIVQVALHGALRKDTQC